MSKKQTAVEWLFNQIKKDMIGLEFDYAEELNQAKEMEKQQIVDAVDGFPIENRNMLGEEYYKKTYELS
jgi:hypothetical protein